jgi:hypothetical protein
MADLHQNQIDRDGNRRAVADGSTYPNSFANRDTRMGAAFTTRTIPRCAEKPASEDAVLPDSGRRL